jgi:hypothetical protein
MSAQNSPAAPRTARSSIEPRGPIDPRGPRFGAALTATLLLAVLFLSLIGASAAALALLAGLVSLFASGTFAGIGRHPFGVLFKLAVRPRLAPPAELEDPAAPTFAQGVGLAVTLVGLVLGLAGVPAAIGIAAALAFVAAFLNAAFDYCLGCQIYLLLVRGGLLGRDKRGSTA